MATLVSFHAHPDDESLFCGGTLAKAAAAGHRTVLVVASDGRRGENAGSDQASGEALARIRTTEVHEAAGILGVARTVFLGYHDSGFGPTSDGNDPQTFSTADTDEAAGRLAGILDEEGADVLTVYDDHGIYPHPDHVHVHRVGVRAAELAGTPRVFEATFDRRVLLELLQAAAGGLGAPDELGLDRSDITTAVDVEGFVHRKRAAMAAHSSQPGYQEMFASMDDSEFRRWFGMEWYRQRPATGGVRARDLMSDE